MTTISELKPIKSSGLDLQQYEGNKVPIVSVEIIEIPSYDDPSEMNKVLKIKTGVVAKFEGEAGSVDICASELFGLKVDEVGNLGWADNPKAKLKKFLEKMNVKFPVDLVTKNVTLRVRSKKNEDGSTKTFLGFITD